MSKTFDLSVEKAQVLVAGIKKNYVELERLGIQWESLKQLEENSAQATAMIAEVEQMRETVSQKLQAANSKLDEVKNGYSALRQIIKLNYPQEQWAKFGLMDKR